MRPDDGVPHLFEDGFPCGAFYPQADGGWRPSPRTPHRPLSREPPATHPCPQRREGSFLLPEAESPPPRRFRESPNSSPPSRPPRPGASGRPRGGGDADRASRGSARRPADRRGRTATGVPASRPARAFGRSNAGAEASTRRTSCSVEWPAWAARRRSDCSTASSSPRIVICAIRSGVGALARRRPAQGPGDPPGPPMRPPARRLLGRAGRATKGGCGRGGAWRRSRSCRCARPSSSRCAGSSSARGSCPA